jgi:hypothetical protein
VETDESSQPQYRKKGASRRHRVRELGEVAVDCEARLRGVERDGDRRHH